MGVFTRSDSKYFWLYLETIRRKERTDILVGDTVAQRRDNRRLADARYHQRMNTIAARHYKLPLAKDAITFTAYAQSYARDTVPHHKGAVREREILKQLMAFFGATPLSLLDQDRVRGYMMARRATVSARTVNREVELLKAMLSAAVPKYLDASPIAGMKKLATVPPTRRLMTPAEEAKILPHLAPDDAAIFLIGRDGLVRLSDILDLRWRDDHGKTIYIADPKDPKQSRPYAIPVSARVRAALDRLPHSDPYMFPRRRRALPEHRGAVIRSALARACEAAHVLYGWKNGGITFHWATRRSGATLMLQRGAELKAVQAIGNWKHPSVMLEIYAESTSAEASRAVELVSRPVPAKSERAKKRA